MYATKKQLKLDETIKQMRVVLKANKFQVIEELGPENVELWSNEGGDDTIHVERGSGYFMHCEAGYDGTGVRALKKMFEEKMR